MNKKKNFIKSAIKKPGSFTAQARALGYSVKELTRRVRANPQNYSLLTRRRANLARTLSKLRKKK
tara:strand:- start:160 stop:354 length:195 start_codon:yes stop_codon:yes gene_type:complete